jgi:carboxyl-terminal processing protease
MLMKKRVEVTPTYMLAIALVVLVVGFVAGTRSQQIYAFISPVFGIHTTADTLNVDDLQATYQTLKANYNGKLSDSQLLEGAEKGLVNAAGDPYTVYFTPKEATDFNNELNGDIGGGVGAEIGMRSNQPTVIRVLADDPAEKAGLHAGDVIIKVNDQSTNGWDAERTVAAIKGEVGTTVKITVNRGSATQTFSITRETINNPSVSSELKGTTGIITLNRFDDETASLTRKAAVNLKDRGMKSLVVDLRGNGGGSLDAAPAVAGLWLDHKLVVTIRSNNGESQRLYSDGEAILKAVPTIILVNEGTASASEILTAALEHYKVSRTVGQTTFGKGTVQQLLSLPGGAELKVTIKRWYTPQNTNINKKGIKPDVSVGLSQSDLNKNQDPQLAKALQLLGQ